MTTSSPLKTTEEPFEAVSPEGSNISGRLFVPAGQPPFPAVVLLLGFGGSYRGGMYRPILERLAQAGIVGVGFDYPEDGRDGDFVNLTFTLLASAAQATIDSIGQRPLVDKGRIGLCGHSMGGIVAVEVASRREDVKALAIVSTAWDPRAELAALWGTTRQRWQEEGFIDLSELDANWGMAGKRKVAYHFYESFCAYDASELVPRLTQPTIVIYGEKDRVVLPDKPQRYFAHLTTEKRLAGIPDADHLFTDRLALERATQAIESWFKEKL
ncbi:MAG: alpha/beta fold hydrolase [Dehalococcoidia bacterium]|nr:alpha/beta fold hydrolase [Dehalococcoidia bacterium]